MGLFGATDSRLSGVPAPLSSTRGPRAPMTKPLPSHAEIVIIGGGVSGCSVAYHLAKLGWTDIVLLERKQLTSGTTWHAAGLIGQLRGSQNMTRLAKYSADLYVKLEAETESAPACGKAARSPKFRAAGGAQARRLAGPDLRCRRARIRPQRSQGEMSASQRRRRRRRRASAARRPDQSDQHRHGAGQGRAARGATIVENVKVTSIQADGRARGVVTDEGEIEADIVVLRRHVGARLGRRTASPFRCMPASISTSSPSRSRASPGCRCCACRTNAPTTRKTPAR